MAFIPEPRINGFEWEKGIALERSVQRHLDDITGDMSRAAHAHLKAHRHDGHAHIETRSGLVDRYVILSDVRGQLAAMTIEYGRGADEHFPNGTRGLWILHDATGLAKKNQRPRSKRKKEYRE